MRVAIIITISLILKASVAVATGPLDAPTCIKAQDDYLAAVIDIDNQFKLAAKDLGIRQLFFDTEKALIDVSKYGCEYDNSITTERYSSPRPVLRPENFDPTQKKERTDTNLEDILRAVTQHETLELSQLELFKRSGPRLTNSEKTSFQEQVSNCWQVDKKSRSADVIVSIAMKMHPDGKVVVNSLKMIEFSGGNQADANMAFQAARRAILRCQKNGYNLPKDKYDQWRNIEIRFDPTSIRRR